MRKNEKAHTLHIIIHTTGEQIVDSYCSCKAGLGGRCSHIIGLLKTLQGLKLHNFTHVPEQQSCTSLPQNWHVPRGNKITPVPINEVIVARPLASRKRKPILCQFDTDIILPKVTETDLSVLQGLDGTPLQYMIQAQAPAPNVASPIGDVQLGSLLSYQTKNIKRRNMHVDANSTTCSPILFPQSSPVKLPEAYKELNIMYQVEDPGLAEEETRGQADNLLWKKLRSNRLTASNFGKILTRKKKPTASFMNSLFPKTDIHSASLSYGRNNEPAAKKRYLEERTSSHLHENGLVINNEFSFLGATPDGKICCPEQNGIIEIKCPYSARDLTLEEASEKIPQFFLQRDNSAKLKLSERHHHYAQVQGQLMITGAKFCDFVVYTKKDLYIDRIYPDIEFMSSMLEKLCKFFNEYAIPYLQS